MSSEKKWTPGPWSIGNLWDYKEPEGCRYITTLRYYSTHHDDPGFVLYSAPVEGLDHPRYEDEARATINLIAAAPELYEALTEALEHWDNARFDIEPPHRIEWADKTRAALAKARGEQP